MNIICLISKQIENNYKKFNKLTSTNDMHVSTEGAKNMKRVARALDVTTGTLTISINNLVRKGYADRARSKEDRRVVLISLSEKGRRAYLHHRKFHDRMFGAVVEGLTEEEQ